MKSLFTQKAKSIKVIGFTPDQLTDEPVDQKLLTRRDIIALEQLHLLLCKVRMLCRERLTREGINHLYEIADLGYRLPLRIRGEYSIHTLPTESACHLKTSRYDRELLQLNSMLYQRLDRDVMYESKWSIFKSLSRQAVPIFVLVGVCSAISFFIGRSLTQ